jgi:hypothetical protein
MTLTMELPQELQRRLLSEAQRRGMPIEQYAMQVLDRYLARTVTNSSAVSLLQSWLDAPTEQEQKETGTFLIEALDRDRLSTRKLFPPELKGSTW